MNNTLLNYKQIIQKIDSCKKKNRNKEDVNLTVVSKTFSADVIEPLILEGHKIYGENKVQEASSKWKDLKQKYNNVRLHLIGPLQTNKVNLALKTFDIIETIDREKLAIKVKNSAENFLNKKFEFFVQVNTGNESQKSGIELTKTKSFTDWIINDLKLNVTGLMCIPPLDQDPATHFKLLMQKKLECNLRHLSMGMSNDFEEAIKAGATFVRVGSAIFGKRY